LNSHKISKIDVHTISNNPLKDRSTLAKYVEKSLTMEENWEGMFLELTRRGPAKRASLDIEE